MSLLEEIRKEKAQIRQETEDLKDMVISEIVSAVSKNATARPVVAGLVNGVTQLYFPVWSGKAHQERVFASISGSLRESGADAAVCGFVGHLDTDKHIHPPSTVVVFWKAPEEEGAYLLPFEVGEDEIRWGSPIIPQGFKSPLIDIFWDN